MSENPTSNVMVLPYLPSARRAAEKKAARGPGRPKNAMRRPTKEDLEYHAEKVTQRAQHVSQDRLVQIVNEGQQSAIETLRAVQADMAREASALMFEREEMAKLGKDTQTVSTRRVAILKEVAHLEIQLKNLKAEGSIDVYGEQMQKLMQLWISKIQSVATDVLSSEESDIFLNALAKSMEAWEEEASSILR